MPDPSYPQHPHHVFDADQVLIGSFDEPEEAHRIAHDATRRPGTRLPVEVADQSARTSRLVWPDRCQSVRWLALDRAEPCSLNRPAVLPGAVGVPVAGPGPR